MANRKLGKLGNLGNLGNIIPSFLISKFSILPYSQNRKLGFKNLGKKFPSFPSLRPGLSRAPFLQNTSRRLLLFVIYLTVSFCKEVLYICSNLLLLEKSSKTNNFAIFSCCKYILYSILSMHLHFRSKHKYKKSCFVRGAATDMRYFARSKFCRSLVHKKKFSLI